MNKTNLECSLNDTSELRKLILENPDLPLIIFCGEDAYRGDWTYEQAYVNSCRIDSLTLYRDMWLDEDDYWDKLSDDMCDEPEYQNLSDEEYEKMIDEKVKNTDFVKAIVVNVG